MTPKGTLPKEQHAQAKTKPIDDGRPWGSTALQAGILIAVAFLLYFNTAYNGYALDDGLVIKENSFTMKGFAGLPAILTHGAFAGVQGSFGGDLSGGRYRPLSMVTFAVEQGLFGANLPISHLVNVLCYCVCVVLLFRLLDVFVFKEEPGAAFLGALIFAIHPVHTEVVANLKSRDELLAFIFLMVSVYCFFRNRTAWSLASFGLALLSKESSITFVAVIALTAYFFLKEDWKASARRTLPYIGVAAGYLLLRAGLVGSAAGGSNELMNAPFLLATTIEAFCTKVVVLGKYLGLLIFPHPLSYDYSFNQIPYAHPFESRFLISLLVNAGLVAVAVLLTERRSVYAYGIWIYFVTISIVSNFVVDVGAPMGERFLFQPSLGFAMIGGYSGYRLRSFRKTGMAALLVVVVFSGYKTILRNRDWRDNFSLFSRDIQVVPNSAKAQSNLAVALIEESEKPGNGEKKKEMLQQAALHASQAAAIYSSYTDAYLDLGLARARLGQLADAAAAFEKAKAIQPQSRVLQANLGYLSELYLEEGVKLAPHDRAGAIEAFEKSIDYNPSNAQALYNLGGVYFLSGDVGKAREYWQKTLQVNPAHTGATQWLAKTGSP